MSVLTFKAADVLRVCEHATQAKDWMARVTDYGNKANGFKPTYAAPEISLALVHDHGVYLMSNGLPRDIVTPGEKPGEGTSFCAYAAGMNPEKDGDEAHDAANAAVGGDDFGEHLGADWVRAMLEDAKAGRDVRIRMTSNKMELVRGRR